MSLGNEIESVQVVFQVFMCVIACSLWFYVMVLFRSLLGDKTLKHKCSFCFVLGGCAHGNRVVWEFLGSEWRVVSRHREKLSAK